MRFIAIPDYTPHRIAFARLAAGHPYKRRCPALKVFSNNPERRGIDPENVCLYTSCILFVHTEASFPGFQEGRIPDGEGFTASLRFVGKYQVPE